MSIFKIVLSIAVATEENEDLSTVKYSIYFMTRYDDSQAIRYVAVFPSFRCRSYLFFLVTRTFSVKSHVIHANENSDPIWFLYVNQ